VGRREPLSVSASVGAALCPADGVTLDALFAAADVRMYENKLRLRALAV
jgi:predicted signal transduction protein with EAL and GGDEF domain